MAVFLALGRVVFWCCFFRSCVKASFFHRRRLAATNQGQMASLWDKHKHGDNEEQLFFSEKARKLRQSTGLSFLGLKPYRFFIRRCAMLSGGSPVVDAGGGSG